MTREKNLDPRSQTNAEWLRDYTKEDETMGLKVKETSSGTNFKKVPQGTHLAVCNLVVDLGMQMTTYQGESTPKHQVYVRWEVPSERIEYEIDGVKKEGPMSIGKTYTASLNEKANLRKDLEGWRNKSFTPEELDGFDIENVLGKPCQITVMHRESNGNTYANVTGVTGIPKGMPTSDAENEILYYGADKTQHFDQLPKWLKEKIGEQVADNVTPMPVADEDFSDDIPF